jgi:DnaJ-class molecular chaperone
MASRSQSRRQELRDPFNEINEAYEILMTRTSAQPDRFGHAASSTVRGRAARGFGDAASAFADIRRPGMGGGRRPRRWRERRRLRYNMEISLEESYYARPCASRPR